MTEYYAHTRYLTDGGDVEMDGTSWRTGAPMIEVAKRILRTPKGSFIPDPTFGLDFSVVQVARSDAGPRFSAAVREAFDSFRKAGLMQRFRVVVEVADDRLRYEISFYDPRAREVASLKGVF